MNTRESYNRILNTIVPTALLEQLTPRTEAYVRVRALSAMLVVVSLVSAIIAVLLTILHLFSQHNVVLLMYFTWGLLLVSVIETLVFYHFQNWRASAVFLSISYFLLICVAVILTGGYQSPLKVLLLSAPLISFLMGGRQEGIINTCFTIALGYLLILAEHLNITFINIFKDQSEYLLATVCWTVTLTVIITCLVVYDVALERKG